MRDYSILCFLLTSTNQTLWNLNFYGPRKAPQGYKTRNCSIAFEKWAGWLTNVGGKEEGSRKEVKIKVKEKEANRFKGSNKEGSSSDPATLVCVVEGGGRAEGRSTPLAAAAMLPLIPMPMAFEHYYSSYY